MPANIYIYIWQTLSFKLFVNIYLNVLYFISMQVLKGRLIAILLF